MSSSPVEKKRRVETETTQSSRLRSIVATRGRLETEFGFSPSDREVGVARLIDLEGGASGDASVVYVEHGAIDVSRAAFDALWRLRDEIPPTPNPMNPKYNLLRTQATFGTTYDFAGQKSRKIGGDDPATWPEPIRDMVDVSKTALENLLFDGHRLAAHVNWYPGGKAGVEPHDDKEDAFVPGAPIFSFTLYQSGLEHDDEHVPRKFQIYAKDPSAKRGVGALLHDIPLPHESLLVMAGATQRDFLHGVKKTTKKEYEHSRRINVTVRVLKGTS
jgi:alkylated DNA repair dioxygenase AlkB